MWNVQLRIKQQEEGKREMKKKGKKEK